MQAPTGSGARIGWATLVAVPVTVGLGLPARAPAQEAPPPATDGASQRTTFTRDVLGVRDLLDEHDGLYVQIDATSVAQYATGTLTDRDTLLNFTYDVAGAWRVYGQPESSEGYLTWWVRGGRPIGASSDSNLTDDVGSVFDVNTSLTQDEVFIQEFYWASSFFDGDLVLAAGRTDPTFRYDFNAIANDEREYFLSAPLVNSSGIPFPDPGLGLDVLWGVHDALSLRVGVHQANSRSNVSGLDRLRSDELLWAMEATYAPSFESLGAGNYRFLVYYIESGGDEGVGFSMSLDQEIGGGLVPFLRYSVAESDITDFDQFFSVGLGVEDPFGRAGDGTGIGYVWGDPTEDGVRSEHRVEAYYRFELSAHVTLSPDLEVAIDPGLNPDDDLIFLFGLRLQVSF